MVQGVILTKEKKRRKNRTSTSPSSSPSSSFIDLKSDLKLRMTPFLVDDEGNFSGDSPMDDDARERKLQRQRRYEQLRQEFSDSSPPPPQPLPQNDLKQESSDSLYGDLDWDAEEEALNKQAEATKREMAKLQRKRNQLKFAKKQEVS